MRLHKHQVGRESPWHSVRLRHAELWNWCAHQQEVERYVQRRRRLSMLPSRREPDPLVLH